MRTILATLGCASILLGTSAACSPTASPGDASERGGEADAGAGAEVTAEAELVGKELPAELLAELRKQGDDADGRLLTLASGFMATAACSDCGAPSYLWFLAVRCSDARHCDVLTEACEGTIAREGERYTLEFHPVEGSAEAEAAAEICASYTGSFEAP